MIHNYHKLFFIYFYLFIFSQTISLTFFFGQFKKKSSGHIVHGPHIEVMIYNFLHDSWRYMKKTVHFIVCKSYGCIIDSDWLKGGLKMSTDAHFLLTSLTPAFS